MEKNDQNTPQKSNQPANPRANMTPVEKYWKVSALFVVFLIIAGLGLTLVLSQKGQKEKKAQDQLYALEALYFKHVEAPTPTQMEAPEKAAVKVDVEKLKSDLQTFVSAHKGSVAAQMASMYLSDLLIKESKSSEALAVLKANKSTDAHLTSLLLIKKIGQIQAQMNQCSEAVTTWDDLLKIKSAKFLKDEIKINQSLCFIEQKDWTKAQKILMEIKNENMKFETLSKDNKKLAEASPETQTAARNAAQTNREVEKILRLIQFRQQNDSAKAGS